HRGAGRAAGSGGWAPRGRAGRARGDRRGPRGGHDGAGEGGLGSRARGAERLRALLRGAAHARRGGREPLLPPAVGRVWRAPALIALAGSLAALGLSIGYIADFSSSARGLQHVTDVSWIGELGIHYKLGLSGLNVFLVALTALLFAAATLAASLRSWERPR